MKNIFDQDISTQLIDRINQLTPVTEKLWGKMTVAQMLAHCNVPYAMIYTNNYSKPNWFKKFLLKLFVKRAVVGEKPYPRNGRTSPEFIIKAQRDYTLEKKLLIENIKKTQALGEAHFDHKESHSFGKLTTKEWSTLFYKHLDHHLKQFGV